jgi:hypothetical protein
MTLAESVRYDTCSQMRSIVLVCVLHTYRSVKHEILCEIRDVVTEAIDEQIYIPIDNFLHNYFLFGKRIQ